MRKKLEVILCSIPPGKVTTYAAIGKLLGVSPRVIGMMLKKNRYPIVIPCHRVIKSDGSLGGYSGPGGVRGKNALLFLEGVRFLPDGKVDPACILSSKELDRLIKEKFHKFATVK